MSLKNLEQRFNEKVSDLYSGAKTKFDNGKPSSGRNDDPLIVRAPGNGYWNPAESRSTPVASAFNDVKRMTLFTASTRGLKFLAKQQLLQTGNTFESTRIINPAFHISNAVPFIHTKRMIDIPITARGIARALLGSNALTNRLLGSGAQKKDVASLRKIGQLQEETYNKATQAISIKSLIKKIPVIGQVVSAVKSKRSVGDGIKDFDESRPELSKLGLRGAITTLFSGNTTSKSGYAMANQVILNSKLDNKYVTNYMPNYYPKLNDTYVTYLRNTDGESTWTHVGQTGNLYIAAVEYPIRSSSGKLLLNVFRQSRTAAAKKVDLLETYKRSNTQTILEKNIPIDKYVDYGTGVRYERTPTLAGLKEIRPKVIPDRKVLEEKYESSSSLETIALEGNQAAYINETLKPTVGQIPTHLIGDAISYVKYFTYGEGTVRLANSDAIKDGVSTNAEFVALGSDFRRRKISYIKDDSNIVTGAKNSAVSKEAYNRINNDFDDPIVVSFAMGKDGHVRFRAYIRDLQQTVNPKYNPLQYIGRMEQFIYYTGVQRDVSFKLGLVAFSREELDGMWRRLNYLTGMAYPYGFNKGIFQPNIVRMTVGNVYVDQPAYITAVNTNFSELSETWELDSGKQVPISAVVSMNFTLVEKASRIADSPFYGITEKLDGFSERIPTAGANDDTLPKNDQPISDNILTRTLQGFDQQDRDYTAAIVAANNRGDTVTVQNIGLTQANRREEFRRATMAITAAANRMSGN